LDILVYQISLMHPAECACKRDSDAQEFLYLQRPTEQSIERLATRVLEHQRHPIVAVRERERPRRPTRVEISSKRVFMFEPLERLEAGLLRGGGDEQDRRQAVTRTPVQSEVALAQNRKPIARQLRHDGSPA